MARMHERLREATNSHDAAGMALLFAEDYQDGRRWVRGGTWEHNQLGRDLQIGLVSMGADNPMDVTSRFDHVRVWALNR